MKPDRGDNPLDRATSQRLQRLSSMPVDTTRVDAWMKAQFGPDDTESVESRMRLRGRSIASIAAVIAVAVLIGVMSLSGTDVAAAPLELNEVHERVTAGSIASVAAADLADAQRQLKALVDGASRPNGDYPNGVRCCCGQTLVGERLTFIKTHFRQTPVTIVLMRGHHTCAGHGHERVDDQGRRFIVHQDHAGVQATLTSSEDHWVCVMAALSTEDLLEVAGRVAF